MNSIRFYSPFYSLFFVMLVSLAAFFGFPNLLGESPVVEVQNGNDDVLSTLCAQFSIDKVEQNKPKKIYYFKDTKDQLDFYTELKKRDHQVQASLNLISNSPSFLNAIGIKPMKLGLDLRGGVHFVLQVDLHSIFQKVLAQDEDDVRKIVSQIASDSVVKEQDRSLLISLASTTSLEQISTALHQKYAQHYFVKVDYSKKEILMSLHKDFLALKRNHTIDATMSAISTRINELGIAEASVYSQGFDHIVVDLPGVQDINQAKRLIGKVATVNFYIGQNQQAEKNKAIPFGAFIKKDKNGKAYLLKKKSVLGGDDIIDAQVSFDPQSFPVVDLRISKSSSKEFGKTTREHVNSPMAVVYKESYFQDKWNEATQRFDSILVQDEHVISFATIKSELGEKFQISGMNQEQSYELALLLRAGSLPTAIKIVEEKIIGPSIGAENIKMGMNSLVLSVALIFGFMVFYYRLLGFIANITLLCNLLFLVAALSLLNATLTLPGIAGIVLTLGMAVDANVLIFERIKEELAQGKKSWDAIDKGFDKAMSTILDSNLTTLIVGVVLFALGSGPIKGFAVTLCLGLITSLFAALSGTKALINFFYRNQAEPNLTFAKFAQLEKFNRVTIGQRL